MLFIGRIQDLDPEDYDEVWLCVRSLRSAPKASNVPTYHKPVLSPSVNLLNTALKFQKSNNWNEETFNNNFAPVFYNEMLNEKPLSELRKLAELSKTKNICVACYCENENLCHRSLLFKIIATMLSD